jgi:hypothetical protein
MTATPSPTLGVVIRSRLPLLALLLAVALAMFASGCSRTTDLGSDDATTTTVRHAATTDPLDAQALETGKAAVDKLQGIINGMLASNDTCAILTQKDVPKNQLDPSLLTSSSARKVLSDGLIKVFDHLIQIGPAELKTAFTDQQTIFSQVLGVVNQYANDPSSSQATEQISTLVQSPGYIGAQAQITAWVSANCK